MTGPLGELHKARMLAERAAEAIANAERRCVRASIEDFGARALREADGQRLYVLLALFDKRDGSYLSDMVSAAREGWERSHPDMAEDTAWDEFDHMWAGRKEELER